MTYTIDSRVFPLNTIDTITLPGQLKFAELLVNHGAIVNVADENHNTALHYAVNAGKLTE